MAGICSRHRKRVTNCLLCNISVAEALPNYAEKMAEAERVGLHTCTGCGFQFYKVTQWCPKCSKPWEDDMKNPPFDDSPACPMCPTEIRNLYAVAFNASNRFEEYSQENSVYAHNKLMEHLRDLKRAVELIQPLVDKHFESRSHSYDVP